MSAHTTHPLAGAYLRDLELLLHGVDPGDRAEVLSGVREHLDGSVAPDADDVSVRAALDELGPPQAIADEAYAGRPALTPTRTTLVGPAFFNLVPAVASFVVAISVLVRLTKAALP